MAEKIGILDLQGDVAEHIDHFRRLNIEVRRIKNESGLKGLTGLVIPGGESTCLSRLLNLTKLDTAIVKAVRKGELKVWGTCAGAILAAQKVDGAPGKLNLIDMHVLRNAFGSQLNSFHADAEIPEISREKLPLTFIRAPKITEAGPEVKILLRINDWIAMAENEDVLATVFHPELTPCLAFHRYFGHKCQVLSPAQEEHPPASDFAPDWNTTSWIR